jgi:hypothetical protein
MLHALKLEWLKYKKDPVFLTLLILYAVMFPTVILFGKTLKETPPPLPTPNAVYEFPYIWDVLGYAGNWLLFFCFGFLSVYIVTSDYTFRTLRQNIISGMSRLQYFIGKLSFIWMLCILATVYYFIWVMFYGYTHTLTEFAFSEAMEWDMILRFALMAFGYTAFGLFIGFLIKRMAISMFIFYAYVMFIEPVFRWAVHYKLFEHKSMHYYPMNAIEDLAPVPFKEIAEEFTTETGMQFFLAPNEAIVIALIYSTLFVLGGYWLLHRRDL